MYRNWLKEQKSNTSEPLSHDKLLVDKTVLEKVQILAAIDRGSSLTKIVYASKTCPDPDKYELNFVLYENHRFEECLEWLQKNALLPSDGGKLHVTGIGCDVHKGEIEEKLGLQIQHIDEFMSQNVGAHFLINNFDEKDITFSMDSGQPQPQPEEQAEETVIPEAYKQVLEAMFQEMTKNMVPGSKFPVLLCFLGSGAGVTEIKEDGTFNMMAGSFMAGRHFLALSKVIIGTGDYDTIVALAEKGNRSNIDTTAADITSGDPNSPYGKFPPDTPLFPLGKIVDNEDLPDNYSREDMARSIIGAILTGIAPLFHISALRAGVNKLYIGGNFTKSSVVRQEMITVNMMPSSGMGVIDIRFLNTGHTGAIGAMISDPDMMGDLTVK